MSVLLLQFQAKDYINPMVNYLLSLYHIDLVDASAIAWRGVMATAAYTSANSFKVGNTDVPKSDLQDTAIAYLLSFKGQPKCAK